MHLFRFDKAGVPTVGIKQESGYIDLSIAAPDLPDDIALLLDGSKDYLPELAKIAQNPRPASIHHQDDLTYLLPIAHPGKIICVGLNYAAHAEEAHKMKVESPYPILFSRFDSTLVAHGDALQAPECSTKFDYEGELVAVVGKTVRALNADNALDCIAGYSIANDATVRDYQTRTHQWTLGKNFDASCGFGPYIVTSDSVPEGGKGLQLTTTLNGQVMQDANTADMLFDLTELLVNITEVMTLHPGDIIVTGTPAGVGFARTPPVYLKKGDQVDITIEGIGTLSNAVT